jgi:hypothetical protein
MCLLLREALSVGKISLDPLLVTSEMTQKEAVLRIEDELSSYCVVVEAAKTTFGKGATGLAPERRGPYHGIHVRVACPVRKTYTGKLYGKQDDLAIAIQLALIGQQKFYSESRYSRYRQVNWGVPNGLVDERTPTGAGIQRPVRS